MRIVARLIDSGVREQISGMRARLAYLGPAYLRAAVVVLAAAQMDIRNKVGPDGGSWAPTLETQQGSSLYRTGALMRSLTVGGDGNVFVDQATGVAIGTNLRTPDGQYSIGELMQYGRGPVKPKNGKMLRFQLNGQTIFSRGVGPAPPRPFLGFNDQIADRVRSVFLSYLINGAIDTGGDS